MSKIKLTQKEEFKCRVVNCLPSDFIPSDPSDEALLKAIEKLSLKFLGVYKEDKCAPTK